MLNLPQPIKGNILIVDDTPANLRLLSQLLHEAGHHVRAVTNGVRALKAVQANPPDLILLDISMPEMSGYEVCATLKNDAHTRHIPIIFISALNATTDKLRAFTAGGVDYITKPFQVREVIARVNTHLTLTSLQVQLAHANQELAHQLEVLTHSNRELTIRNQELDAFAHTVAHDLKSPLTFLKGYGELLIEEYATLPRSEILHYAKKMVNGTTKLDSIVDNLLLLASIRTTEIATTPLDMHAIVNEAQQRLSPMLAQYQATLNMPTTWPHVMGYAPWVEEIWVNYINNAIKYGGDSDLNIPPHVELGFDPPSQLPANSPPGKATTCDYEAVSHPGNIRFWVKDNGPGLSAEAQARLFMPFERLHQTNINGHGLGLSIVRRIAQRLCGEVGVESQFGLGSTFYFALPPAPQPH